MFRDEPLRTAVLLLIFNRAGSTQLVFDAIRKARPSELYVSADGPRQGKAEDGQRCRAARDVIRQVDWPCEVHTNFRERNLGLKTAVSEGISWMFEHVDRGIILEDDCVPSQSFFWFCQELLDRYYDDKRIMQISGSNFLFDRWVTGASYYFSKLNDVWGWATWKRAWRYFDINMSTFAEFKQHEGLQNYIDDSEMREWLMSYFEQDFGAEGSNGLWSSQWAYAICTQNGLTIVPTRNLVRNIGFLDARSWRREPFRLYSMVEQYELGELVHPRFVLPNRKADLLRFDVIRRTDPRVLYRRGNKLRTLVKRYVPKRYHRAVRAIVDVLRGKGSGGS